MIRGMAHAGARARTSRNGSRRARRALDFIRRAMWREGRLLATYKDGRAHLNAYLDDYALLLAAMLELMQERFDAADLEFARKLADALLEQFEDAEAGGFFFTSHDHEQLIQRPKPPHDNATPSGNAVAAWAPRAACGDDRRGALRSRRGAHPASSSTRRCATIRPVSPPWHRSGRSARSHRVR